ncbi:MAG TPA: radical SAM family heme chaperone HemW [Alphaproteobacteria bacterium]|nr:radical SAM family heme chaperone HemW [Alphaproteobacteria bacterium]
MPAFAIYVHWPFCRSKCPYCDFNSHVRDRIDEESWRGALLAELDHYAELAPGRVVTSVFFGGGTPSLMAPGTAEAVLQRIARRWELAADAEITLEANPNSAEAEHFAGFRAAGINRMSIGVQALEDRALRFLGRAHDAAEARRAIGAAQRQFGRYSFDLIYARPRQTIAEWTRELRDALTMASDHLSVYQLTIEPGTAFHAAHARGEVVLPSEDEAAELFEATQDILATAGLPAYEISNHARRGSECRHNLAYWRYDDYVGVGPGAHGRLTLDGKKVATRQERAPETWLAAVRARGHATAEAREIAPRDAAEEALMMGLRLTEGIAADEFRHRTGIDLDDALDRSRLTDLIGGGFVVHDPLGLRATRDGRRVLNAVLAQLIA